MTTVVPTQSTPPPLQLPLLDIIPHTAATYVNILLMGASGIGKTRMAGETAFDRDVKRVLFVDFEDGTLTLRHVKERVPQKIDFTRIPSVNPKTKQMRTFNQSVEVIRQYIKTTSDPDKALPDGTPVYDVLVLDPLNEAAKVAMAEIMKPARDAAVLAGQLPPPPRIQDYGTCAEMIRGMVRTLKDLPCHLIATCLEKRTSDELTKRTYYQPDLITSLASGLPALFDEVLWLGMRDTKNREPERFLLCKSDSERTAKDRSDSLTREIVDPTTTKLFDAFFNR